MNFYDLCDGISRYILQFVNEKNTDIRKFFSKENIQILIRQRKTEDIELLLSSRKSLDALILLKELRFFTKLDLH